jgi:tight adherence protein B
MPDEGVLLSALVGGALGVALIALAAALRGRVPTALRAPSRWARMQKAVRSPQLAARIGAAVIVGVLTLVATRWPVAAAAVAVLIAAWPQLLGGARAERVEIARLEELVIWMESLRDTTAAHIGLEQAIAASTTNAGPLLQPALVRLIGRIRARVPLDLALLRLAADIDDARSADPLIAALVLNVRRRGDRLGQVLSGLTNAGRAELDFRRHVLSSRAEVRRGVQILVSLTLATAGYLALVNRSFGRPYASPAGQVALLVVVALFSTGLWWLRRLAIPDQVAPFLPREGHQLDSAERRLVATLTSAATTGAVDTPRARRWQRRIRADRSRTGGRP